jgi:hypothetical protein
VFSNKGIISLRWSERFFWDFWFYKHFVPPGLKTEQLFVTRTLETGH